MVADGRLRQPQRARELTSARSSPGHGDECADEAEPGRLGDDLEDARQPCRLIGRQRHPGNRRAARDAADKNVRAKRHPPSPRRKRRLLHLPPCVPLADVHPPPHEGDKRSPAGSGGRPPARQQAHRPRDFGPGERCGSAARLAAWTHQRMLFGRPASRHRASAHLEIRPDWPSSGPCATAAGASASSFRSLGWADAALVPPSDPSRGRPRERHPSRAPYRVHDPNRELGGTDEEPGTPGG